MKMLFHYFSQQSISSKAELLPLHQRRPFLVGHIPADQVQRDKYVLRCWQLQTQTYESPSLIIKKKRNVPRYLARTTLQPNRVEMRPFGGPVPG